MTSDIATGAIIAGARVLAEARRLAWSDEDAAKAIYSEMIAASVNTISRESFQEFALETIYNIRSAAEALGRYERRVAERMSEILGEIS